MAGGHRRRSNPHPTPTADAVAALEAEWEAKLSAEGLGSRVRSRQMRGPRGTDERRKAKDREVLVKTRDGQDPDEVLERLGDHDATRRPVSDSEAIMRSGPHEEAARSLEASYELREKVLDAMEQLDTTDCEIVSQIAFGSESAAQVARNLGYSADTTVIRRYRRAIAELRELLKDDPMISDYLEGKI